MEQTNQELKMIIKTGNTAQRTKMKSIIKNVLIVATAVAILSSFIGCSEDSPSVRVANQRVTKANVQFKQANGNTINQNDVLSGTNSNFQDIIEGAIVVTAVIQGEAVSPTVTFNASNDNNYTDVIVGGDPPVLRVDTLGK